MSALWIAAGVLTLAVAALLVAPLLRRGSAAPAGRGEYDLVVYRQQLAEIDRDVERGLIDPGEAEAARIEVKRRILADAAEAEAAPSPPRSARRPALLAGMLATAVAAGAFALYLRLGTPEAPDQPLAERRAAEPATARSAGAQPALQEAVARLRQRLAENPGDLDGWLLLGRSALSLERYAEAVEAFRRAAELSGQRPDVVADYGEALVAAAAGRVSPESREAFARAFAGDPLNVRARYYLALDKAQQGDTRGALQSWVDLVTLSPPNAPWLAAVDRQIRRAAEELGVDPESVRPSAEALALRQRLTTAPGQAGAPADMAAGERSAMIRSMVERLAARLDRQPDDVTGWEMLARAYAVLGETDKAAEARARVEALKKERSGRPR